MSFENYSLYFNGLKVYGWALASWLGLNMAKCEVYPGTATARELANSMFPVVLGGTSHQLYTAAWKTNIQTLNRSISFVTEINHSLLSQAQGCNDWLRPQFGFIVCMQAHRILLVTVVVEQYAVEWRAGQHCYITT